MARTPITGLSPVEPTPLDGDTLTASQNLLSTVAQEFGEERDLLNQLLGQAQMAGAFEDFSRTVRTSKLAYVKENKLYRALAGKKSPNGSELSGTWEEFCSLLGMSVDKADLDIGNLRAFGEEALESMSRMGIGYRELRQFRRLPEDQKTALIEVAKTGDKESFVELAEEIISKAAKEKEALSKELEDTRADYAAQGELMAHKTAELDNARLELERSRRQVQAMSVDERAKALRQEVAALAYEAETTLRGGLRAAFSQLGEAGDPEEHRLFQAALVRQLEITLAAIRSEFHLPALQDADALPPWMTLLGIDDASEA